MASPAGPCWNGNAASRTRCREHVKGQRSFAACSSTCQPGPSTISPAARRMWKPVTAYWGSRENVLFRPDRYEYFPPGLKRTLLAPAIVLAFRERSRERHARECCSDVGRQPLENASQGLRVQARVDAIVALRDRGWHQFR